MRNDNEIQQAIIIDQLTDDNDQMIGSYLHKLIYNTIICDMKLKDGTVKQKSTNVIAMNLIETVYIDICATGQPNKILDMKADKKLIHKKENKKIITPSEKYCNIRTIDEWRFLVYFQDRYKSWVPLRVLKNL